MLTTVFVRINIIKQELLFVKVVIINAQLVHRQASFAILALLVEHKKEIHLPAVDVVIDIMMMEAMMIVKPVTIPAKHALIEIVVKLVIVQLFGLRIRIML